jgi:glycosyltransferase involved in cell wall biosynthesis
MIHRSLASLFAGFDVGMLPKITTIIPTFRRPQLLRRAIRSVLAQNYDRFRVCIYDNASGDETAAVVGQFAREDPRVHYYCHSSNIGAWDNFK